MSQYATEGGRTYKVDDETGERSLLANFTATITREVRYLDGDQTETYLTIKGEGPGDTKKAVHSFPEVEIPGTDFAGMNWVMKRWGVRAVIQPGQGIRPELAAAIQLSSTPTVETVYKHIGWTRIHKALTYLHAGGGLNANGNDPSIKVALPVELSKFNLANPSPAKDAIMATIMLCDIAPPATTWPMLAATFAPLFGPVDFALHLSGKTGTFKSEMISLWQSHYGREMDARHLPGSWSSTPNALEAQAYVAKNAAFVIDDFVPNGGSYQQRSMHQAADKLFRAQGNQAGRARLTDVSALQTTMYPRGIILSTGEDIPDGHSVRARTLILEMTPGDVNTATLTACQQKRPLFIGTTASLIQALAAKPIDIRPAAHAYRDTHIAIGHSRTPPMIGHLMAVIDYFLAHAKLSNAIDSNDEMALRKKAHESLLIAAQQQQQYLEQADPGEQFLGILRGSLGAKLIHLRTVNGGVPKAAGELGWTQETSTGDLPQWKSHGPCIGWIDTDADEVYLDTTIGYATLHKLAKGEMTLSKSTLIKRLKDDGILVRIDEGRNRNFIRLTAENHARNVLVLSLSNLLETQEKP